MSEYDFSDFGGATGRRTVSKQGLMPEIRRTPLSQEIQVRDDIASKLDRLANAINTISAQYAKTDAAEPIPVVSTGSVALDKAIGLNGLPKGYIVEVSGKNSPGKTTSAYHMIAETQKSGGTAAFVDVSGSFSRSYATKIGVKADLILSQPSYGEQALAIVTALVHSNMVDLIVMDSIAALLPQSEWEGVIGDETQTYQEAIIRKACRSLQKTLQKNKITLVFINDLTSQQLPNGGFGEVSVAERTFKAYAAIRIRKPG